MDALRGLSPPEIYERFLVPPIFAPWAEALLARAAPQRQETILDLACGTGIVARLALAATGGRGLVAGLDNDPAMLALARDLAPAIAWVRADAMAMPFRDGSFDLVLCQQGIQFLPDTVAGLAEARRVLRPGGRIAFAIWGPLAACPGHAAVFEELGALLGPAFARPLAWSIPTREEKERLARAAGFVGAEVAIATRIARFPSAAWFTACFVAGASRLTRQALDQVGEAERTGFAARVARRLRPYEADGALAVPTECHLAIAMRP